MGSGKGKHANRGKDPFRIKRKIKLVRRKAKASEPVACMYMNVKYASLTAAAKDKKRSRTYISRVAERI